MKILFFVNNFPCISETFVLNQICNLLEKNHDVRIYSWGIGDKKPHEDFFKYNLSNRTYRLYQSIPRNKFVRFYKILPFLFKTFIKHGIKSVNLISKKYGLRAKNLLISYIGEGYSKIGWKPDAIICHFGDNGILMQSLISSGIVNKITPCFTFIHAHEICKLSISDVQKIYFPIFNKSHFLLPINTIWAEKLISAGANAQKVILFRMGIDSSKFKFKHLVTKEDNKIQIISVGRLVGQKGFKYAIEGVAKYIHKTHKQVKYTIIGTGPLEHGLKNLAKNLGIEQYVDFLGSQTQDVVIQRVTSADIFLLPSVTDENGFMEGIPVALMEAMAIGTICISTFHSGIPELIENNISGFLCEEKNSSDISKALMNFESLSESEKMNIRENAYNTIKEHFDLNNLMNSLIQLINAKIN